MPNADLVLNEAERLDNAPPIPAAHAVLVVVWGSTKAELPLLLQAQENALIRRLFGAGVGEYRYYFTDGITPEAAARLQALGFTVHGIVR